MALVPGSVTADANGNVSGTGFALTYFGALAAVTPIPDPVADGNAAANGVTPAIATPAYLAATGKTLASMKADAYTTAYNSSAQSRISTINSLATQANLAASIVAYILANAQVTLSGATAKIASGGLFPVSAGTLPTTMTAGTPIGPPAADVNLPVTGSGTLT